MKSSASLLLALAGAFGYYTLGKKSNTSKSVSEVSKFGSKETGYEVVNCTKLTIYDKYTAYKWAFNLGIQQFDKLKQNPNYEPNSNMLLFGNCFQYNDSDSQEIKLKNQQKFSAQFKQLFNTKEKAEFIFTLAKYLFSGIISTGIDSEEYVLARLSAMRDALILVATYDVSGLTLDVSDVHLKA